ncbi:hypothetical protein ACN2XU_02910 [Primorskyibacter sp. 2E107]|uniref:hypothetical protein n=1 Tax=Primorskyibacter sp. 2E107 TaxID=3403458 RepID=UPI003AF8E56B
MFAPRPLLAAGLALLGTALPLAAQERGEAGGVWLRFGITQRIEATQNADLSLKSDGPTFGAETGLAFSLSSETRSDYLGLTIGTALRHVSAPDPDDDVSFGIKAPRVELSYRRNGAGSQFQSRLSAQVEDIAYLRGIAEFLNEDGTLPEGIETVEDLINLDDRRATGQRRTLAANSALRVGEGGPVEAGLRLTARHVDYFDTDPTLYFDSQRYALRGDVKLRLADNLTMTSQLGYAEYHEEGSALRETWDLGFGLSHERPRGSLSFSVSASQVEEGTSYSLSSGWAPKLANGSLSFSLGASRSANGTDAVTGGVSYSRKLPRGTLSAQLRRGLTSGTEDTEELFTLTSASYRHAFSPLTGMQFSLSYLDTKDLAAGARTNRGELGLGIQHRLSKEWAVNLGYRRVMLRETAVGSGWAESDSVYVSMGRTFSHRF